jgi:toxin ParE1/3/4
VKVRFLRGARRNVADMSAWIRRDNPAAASRVGRRIQEVVGKLAKRPGMGAPGQVPGTREFKIPGLPYRIVYRVAAGLYGEALEILRVQHEARDEHPPDWEGPP